MAHFAVHTKQSAPEGAGGTLEKVERGFGFVPNLMGVMAEAPPLLDAYLTLYDQFGRTGLTPTARQIVLLAVSYENECDYCMAAHSTGAAMGGVPAEIVDALRHGRPLPDAELEALRRFVAAVVRERGRPPEGEIERFLAAGYTKTNILEVVLGVGLKTLSNYTDHIAVTPLDAAFAPQQWRKAS